MDAVSTALQLVDKYGVAIVALVCVTAFAWWAVRSLVRSLERQNADVLARLDRALDVGERQVDATAALTRELHTALDNRGELMGLLEDAVQLARERR